MPSTKAALGKGAVVKKGDPPVSMNEREVKSAIYGAATHTLGLEKRGKLGGLTRDMAAAIYLYTMDTHFYKIINAMLREVDRNPLKSLFPYLKLVMTGLRRLEKQETKVFRGVSLPLSALDGAEHYIPGNVVVWWPFSSSSISQGVLSDPQFLGTSGKRTLFTIKVSTARDIRAYSWKAKENELLILPGTPFKVGSVEITGDLTTIELEEDVDAPDMIDSGDDTYEMVDFKDAQEGFYDLVGDAYDVVEDGSGGGGAAAGAYDLVGDFKREPWDFRGESREVWTNHLGIMPNGYFVVRDTDKVYPGRVVAAALTYIARKGMTPSHITQVIMKNDNGTFSLKGCSNQRKNGVFRSIPEMIKAYRDPKKLTVKESGNKVPSVPLTGYI